MNQAFPPLVEIAAVSRRVAQQVMDLGASRRELLAVEAQAAREHRLHAFLFSLGAAGFGLPAGITPSAGMVILLRPYGPLIPLAAPTLLYGGRAGFSLSAPEPDALRMAGLSSAGTVNAFTQAERFVA
jgi:hypothetical protein